MSFSVPATSEFESGEGEYNTESVFISHCSEVGLGQTSDGQGKMYTKCDQRFHLMHKPRGALDNTVSNLL